jgi:hypothetical protein
MLENFGSKCQKKLDLFESLCVNGMIILKWLLEEYCKVCGVYLSASRYGYVEGSYAHCNEALASMKWGISLLL